MPANKLEYEKISKLLLELSIPAIIAQLVSVLYNMVDRIYVGQMADGTTGMAALSITLPIVTLVIAFSQLFGLGGSPLCAIKMGEKDQTGAEKIMANSFVMLIISGIIITVCVLLFKRPLLYMFGATEQTIDYADSYLTIYILGTVLVQITLGMNPYINTQGFAKKGMITTLIGAVLNIVLDPLFIFVLDMGVAGAALATIISQGVSALWVLKFLLGSETLLKIKKEYLKIDYKTCLTIMSLGVSPFVMQFTDSLLQVVFNQQLLVYGGTIAIASMAILTSLWQFIFLPLNGLCQGAQPILSFNYGSKNLQRVKQTFKLVFILCFLFSLLAGGVIMIFSRNFASIFTNDSATLSFAAWALRIYLFGTIIFGMQCACQQSFMALGQAKVSLLMAINRKVILLIPLLYILPLLLTGNTLAESFASPVLSMVVSGSGVFAVFLAEPISDILSAIITTVMFYRFYRKELSRQKLFIEKNLNSQTELMKEEV